MPATTYSIPESYTARSTFDVYLDPLLATGAGAGAGTANSPYTSIATAMTAWTAGLSLGIRSGRTLDVSSQISLTATAGCYTKTGVDDLVAAIWIPSGAPRTPSVFYNAILAGTLTSDWEEVDYKPLGTPGDAVTHGGGTYDLLASSGVWHYKGTITAAIVIKGIGVGSRYSIDDVVSASGYKQHGPDASHVDVAWLEEGSGATAGEAVINPSSVERREFTQDKQWTQTDSGGFVIKSTSNPATRWGGVYFYQGSSGILHLSECDDYVLEHAFQAHYCGKIMNIRNNNDAVQTGSIVGIYGSYVGAIIPNLSTDQRSFGGQNDGSCDMTAGTNKSVVALGGDGTSPWQECDMSYIRGDHIFASADWSGWQRNCKVHDIVTDMANLQSGASLVTPTSFGLLGTPNEWYNFDVTRMTCGVGRFGRTDYGMIQVGTVSGNFYVHDGTIRISSGAMQLGGGHRHQGVYNVRFVDCIKGLQISDETHDGSTSVQVANCSFQCSKPGNWAVGTISVGADFTKSVGLDIALNARWAAKGDAADTDTWSHNDGWLVDNCVFDIGDCPQASAYCIANRTLNASAAEGPWHAVGGVGVVANNGRTVVLNQQQLRQEGLATIGKIAVHSGFASTQVIVDTNYADALGGGAHQQPITGSQTAFASSVTNSDGFWTSSASSTIRTGGTILVGGVTIDTDVDYARVADNDTDIRKVPRWGNQATIGPIQYIPTSTTTRTGLTA